MRTYTLDRAAKATRQISILAKLEMDMEAGRMLEFSSGLRGGVGIDSVPYGTSPLISPDLSPNLCHNFFSTSLQKGEKRETTFRNRTPFESESRRVASTDERIRSLEMTTLPTIAVCVLTGIASADIYTP